MPVHLQEGSAGKDDANTIRRQNADQITNESNGILEKHDNNAREAQNDRLPTQNPISRVSRPSRMRKD